MAAEEPSYITRRQQKKQQQAQRDSVDRDAKENKNYASAVRAAARTLKKEIRVQAERYYSAVEGKSPREVSIKNATWVAAFAAIIATVLALFNLIFFVRLTLGTNSTARDAANDAHEAYSAVQRAFISLSDIQTSSYLAENANGTKETYWAFRPVIENSGTTPTQDLVYVSQVVSFARQAEGSVVLKEPHSNVALEEVITQNATVTWSSYSGDQVFPPDPGTLFGTKPPPERRAFIGPHSPVQTSSISFKEIDLIRDIKRAKPPYILGEIRYHDIFRGSPEHITKYCFIISSDSTVSDKFLPTKTFCPYWNCADKECEDDKRRFDEDEAKARAEGKLPSSK